MHYLKILLILMATSAVLVSKGQKHVDRYGQEDLKKLPAAPDYTDRSMWAGHPSDRDAADLVPGQPGELSDQQQSAAVDVFFVHPTIYIGKPNPENPWNADLSDSKLNQQVDESTIKNQASVFNGSARVFAPRYRQAHYNVFLTQDLILKQKALDHAYEDVRNAFEYYLEQWNEDRPLIIAAHSQGTLHAARLIKDFIEDKPLQEKLVVAYIVGMPLPKNIFESISPCEGPEQTGCWITWNTYARDYYPDSFKEIYHHALSTNPLNWKIDESYAPATKNLGGVLRNYKRIRPEINDAQNHRGILWISKPKFFGNALFNWKRYHVADYNLFYVSIRENVALRVKTYLESTTLPAAPR